jgi:hypothetical protein
VLLFIIFVIAEIGNVLINSDPRHAKPLTIWEEVHQPSDASGNKYPFRP